MLIWILVILVMIGFYQTARSFGLNGVLYAILAGVCCYGGYFVFAILTVIVSKNLESSAIGIFGFVGAVIGTLLFFIIMQSIGRSRSERTENLRDEYYDN